MTQYNDIRNLSTQIADLRRQIRDLTTQPRAISTSIDRGGTRSSDYNGSGIDSPGTTGWMIGTDETTGKGYVHIGGNNLSSPEWTTFSPTPLNFGPGWGNYTAGSFQTGYWVKDGLGWVHLEGVIMRTGAALSNAASGTIFTLPVGARPPLDLLVPGLVGNTSIRFTLNAAGVFLAPSITIASGTGGFISLNSIKFKAA